MASMYKVWFVGLMFLLIGVLATASAQAYIIDGTIFDDEFNSTGLNQWYGSWVGGDGSATEAGGVVTVHSSHPNSHYARYATVTPMDFSSSPNDWWVEVKFKMVGYLDDCNEKTDGYRPGSWVILCGDANKLFNVRGFDLRALEHTDEDHTEAVYDLGWWGASNNTGSDGGNPCYHQAEVLYENLDKDTSYVVNLHRKPDGNVDIYLDDTLIATKPLIHDENPSYMTFGDPASIDVGGTEVIDYVRIGQIPEPGALVLLASGLVGLLCYAWRKRK